MSDRNCACVSMDARDCYQRRYESERPYDLDSEEWDTSEVCECICHDDDDYEY